MKRSLMALAIVLAAPFANGNQIHVEGMTRVHDQNGAGNRTVRSAFEITYRNQDLPWGTRVALISGLRCANGGSWQMRTFPEEMQAVAAYTWQIKMEKTTGSRYTGLCRFVEFAFEITLPDGRKVYDNGGLADMGFYSAAIPYREGQMSGLPLARMRSAYDYPAGR